MYKLPRGWDWVCLNDLQADEPRAITDGPFGSNLTSAHYTADGARVVRLQNIGDGVFNDAEAFISPKHFDTLKQHQVLAGDLLLASLGEDLPRACLAPPHLGPAVVKADCIRVRLSPRADPRWVLYALQTDNVRRWAKEHLHGVGRPRLGLTVIRAIPVPLPSLEEQQRIVEILEDHLSRLDAADDYVASARTRAVAMRASVLAHLWAESERVGKLRSLADLGRVVTGATPRHRVANQDADTLPFVTPGDIGHGDKVGPVARSLPRNSISPSRVLTTPGVLAVCIGATLGKVGWTARPVATNQQINAVLVEPNVAGFVSALMASPAFQSQMHEAASATTMPILNKRQFSKLQVPIPSPPEQQKLLGKLDSLLEAVRAVPAAAHQVQRREESLRRTLLHAAFSGRLTRNESAVAS